METLKKFWHWADNEKPNNELFDAKSTASGPMSEEAQEAMEAAVDIVAQRAPDGIHLTSEPFRPALKLLSTAILEAWQLIANDERVQEQVAKQAAKYANVPKLVIPKIGEFGTWSDSPSFTKEDVERWGHAADAMSHALGVKVVAMSNPVGNVSWVRPMSERKPIPPVRLPFFDDRRDSPHQLQHPLNLDHGESVDLTYDKNEKKWHVANRRRDQNAVLAMNYGMGPRKLNDVVKASQDATLSVIRTWEHDDYRSVMLSMMRPSDCEHLHVRVDSRGILFQSTEFNDIEMLCDFKEFETRDPFRIDEHKLHLVVGALLMAVTRRKEDAEKKTLDLREGSTPIERVSGSEAFAQTLILLAEWSRG